MRYLYSENEPIEKHPPRGLHENLVVINKTTGMPTIAEIVGLSGQVGWIREGRLYHISPRNWEIAWP